MSRTTRRSLGLLASLAVVVPPASAATLVARYDFDGTLASSIAGAPSLVAIDPLSRNRFESATVAGQPRTVYRWDGNGELPQNQAGLTLDATGLVNYGSYSVAITFEFTELPAFGGGWRRILDTQNRQSDSGFYSSPDYQNDALQAVELTPGAQLVTLGTTPFTTPGFHEVVISVDTVDGHGVVKGWLDGKLELTASYDQFALDNANNPGHLLHFFADNLVDQAQQEFADGRIASLELYDGVFAPVPEPGPSALVLAGLAVLVARNRGRIGRIRSPGR